MNFRPIKGRVLVKCDTDTGKTESGLYLVSFNPNKAVEGTVLAIGELENFSLVEGQKVLYQYAAGTEVKIDDQKFHMVDEEHLLGAKEGDDFFFEPPENGIYVINLEKGERRTKFGLLITDDGMTERGIRPRWAQVWKVGKNWEGYVEPEQWVLLEHGNWSNIITLKKADGSEVDMQIIEEKSIKRGMLGVQDEMPEILTEYGIDA